MERRKFIKLSLAAGAAILLPDFTYAANLDVSQINFSSGDYAVNNAQTIMIFMYGGASQLAGNISNIEEIENKSQSSYDYFRGVTKTVNGCWQEAGGIDMETLMDNGDMTLFRCCYSAVREEAGNKAHGECTLQILHRSSGQMEWSMKIPSCHLSLWKESPTFTLKEVIHYQVT